MLRRLRARRLGAQKGATRRLRGGSPASGTSGGETDAGAERSDFAADAREGREGPDLGSMGRAQSRHRAPERSMCTMPLIARRSSTRRAHAGRAASAVRSSTTQYRKANKAPILTLVRAAAIQPAAARRTELLAR
jgi:hypothetical protein